MTSTRPLITFTRLLTRSTPHTSRQLSTTPTCRATENPHSQRDAQDDREKMSVEPNEVSKSMTDSDAAKQDEAAYDTKTSQPQEAKKKAGEGKDVNPLDASPANPEISQQTSEASSGAGEKVKESNQASGGSTTGGKN